MDWIHGDIPGLFEGPAFPPSPPPTGTLFKLKSEAFPGGVLHVFDGGKWVRIEDAVEMAARMICQLEPRDRLRAVEYMRDRFCLDCGHDHPDGHPCYCNRDPERD